MPSYPFVCPKCGAETTRFKSIATRNENPPQCVQHREKVTMKRKPAAANFVVTGFNAKNGYSK